MKTFPQQNCLRSSCTVLSNATIAFFFYPGALPGTVALLGLTTRLTLPYSAMLLSSANLSFCAKVVVLDEIAFLGKVAAGVISRIPLAGIDVVALVAATAVVESYAPPAGCPSVVEALELLLRWPLCQRHLEIVANLWQNHLQRRSCPRRLSCHPRPNCLLCRSRCP